MTEIWKSITDTATSAYDGAKQQLHDHPLLYEALGVGATVPGAIAFRGKLGEFGSTARVLFGKAVSPVVREGESLLGRTAGAMERSALASGSSVRGALDKATEPLFSKMPAWFGKN